ncbi:uncharacterized protein LOC128952453 [Oppia nitens]|uniref:uncharacterized protein LOC128952453 n=1 Tax=Oppia nitens TaxID=1686743 RepID=UPI0023D9F5F1|nr:uncharacterized protein LOC128952453 [Oppia nitens]
MATNSQQNTSKTVLIENGHQNINNDLNRSYGAINNSISYASHISDDTNKSLISKATTGVYNAGAGVVTYGLGGIKWVLSSTTSVGSTVLSAGTAGVVQLKKRASKDKNE